MYPYEFIEGRDAENMDLRLSYMAAAVQQALECDTVPPPGARANEWTAMSTEVDPKSAVKRLREILGELQSARVRLRVRQDLERVRPEPPKAYSNTVQNEVGCRTEVPEVGRLKATQVEVATKAEADNQARVEAVTKVQSLSRGRHVRVCARQQRDEEHRAATAVQAAADRRQAGQLAHAKQQAAIRIQSSQRGKAARHKAEERRQQMIQADAGRKEADERTRCAPKIDAYCSLYR